MKTIELEITSEDKKEHSPVTITKHVNRGAGDVEMEKHEYTTNKDGKKKFQVSEGESLNIVAYPPSAIAYDKEQMAAYKVDDQKEKGKMNQPQSGVSEEEKKILKAEEERLKKEHPDEYKKKKEIEKDEEKEAKEHEREQRESEKEDREKSPHPQAHGEGQAQAGQHSSATSTADLPGRGSRR